MLWSRRPIQADLLQYAAEDVLQLLQLADKLKAEMGKAGMVLMAKLSGAYSQWYWEGNANNTAAFWDFGVYFRFLAYAVI